MQLERRIAQDAQAGSRSHVPYLALRLPDFHRRPLARRQITISDRRDQIEHFALHRRTQQLHVLGVGPHQWDCGAGGLAKKHALVPQIRAIPNLLRQQSGAMREFFHRPQIRIHRASRSQLVMPALAGEQRPGTSHPPALE